MTKILLSLFLHCFILLPLVALCLIFECLEVLILCSKKPVMLQDLFIYFFTANISSVNELICQVPLFQQRRTCARKSKLFTSEPYTFALLNVCEMVHHKFM